MKGIYLVNDETKEKFPYPNLKSLSEHLGISITTIYNLLTGRCDNKRGTLKAGCSLIYMTPEEYQSHYPKPPHIRTWHCEVCNRDYKCAESLHKKTKKHNKRLAVLNTVLTPETVSN
jgi:hypothetical protein